MTIHYENDRLEKQKKAKELKERNDEIEEEDEYYDNSTQQVSTSLNNADFDSFIEEMKDKDKIKSRINRSEKSSRSSRKTNDLVFDSFSEPDASLPAEFEMGLFATLRELDIEYVQFRNVFHLIVILLGDLQAGTMTFSDVLGVNRQPNFREFCQFLQTLEVYGSGYGDDVSYFDYNKRSKETHTETMIKSLQRVIQGYDLAIYIIENQTSGEKLVQKHMLCLLNFQRSIFRKLVATQ